MISQADLERYLEHPLDFLSREVILPDGRAWGDVWDEWQEEMLSELLQRDGDGRWAHSLSYVELARGHAKTATLAALGLLYAIFEADARIYYIAADAEQAGIAFEFLTGFINRNPRLQGSFKIGAREIIVTNGTRLKVMASDVGSAYGLGGTGRAFIVLSDEIWVWKRPAFWTAFWTASGKLANWRIVAASTAGWDKSSLAWELRQMCEEKVDESFHLFSREGVLGSWIKPSWVEMQRRTLPAHVFAREILNQWTQATGAVFLEEWWRYFEGDGPEAVIQSWDTSFGKSTSGDYSVCQTWGVRGDGLYLLDVWRGRPPFPELKRVAVSLYEKHRPEWVLVEDAASGQSLLQELEAETSLPLKRVRPDRDKVSRAYAVTPLIEHSNVFLPRGAPWLREFLAEHSQFPAARFDDQVDATTQALNYLREHRRRPWFMTYITEDDAVVEIGGGPRGQPEAESSLEAVPVGAREREAERIAAKAEETARERRIAEGVAALERAGRSLRDYFGAVAEEGEEGGEGDREARGRLGRLS